MEIGHQAIDHVEWSAWEDEDIGVAAEGLEYAITRRTLQRAHAGGSHSHYAPATRLARRYSVNDFLGNFQPFAVHMVVFNVIHTYRLKRAGPHVQGHIGGLNALGGNRIEQRLIKVQACSRCCYSTQALGVNRLIALAVRVFVGTIDIRRQRHVADALQQGQHLFGELELEQRVMTRHHLGFATAIDEDLRSRFRRLAGAHMGQYAMTVQHPLHQNFQLAAGSLLAKQPCRDHPGIVEHHQVARAQMFKQISELTVCEGTAHPIQGEQSTGATLGQRVASNQRIWEFKSKVSNAHD